MGSPRRRPQGSNPSGLAVPPQTCDEFFYALVAIAIGTGHQRAEVIPHPGLCGRRSLCSHRSVQEAPGKVNGPALP
jgi:hypothetical protein